MTSTVTPTPTASSAPLCRRLDLEGHCTVVGLQWGDEGKGKVVDLLAPGFDLVVRYNGGANAGHSVQVGEDRYALHLIPSGILYPEKLNVLGNGVVIDPAQLVKEIDGMTRRGLDLEGRLRVSDRAHVVMPYHKTQDALMEASLARARGEAAAIGTTGRGIGPCYADKALRSTAIRIGDFIHLERFRDKLEATVAVKNVLLAALAKHAGADFEPFDPATLYDELAPLADRLRPHVCDTATLLHRSIAKGHNVLFEGANATLLDIDHGTFPFVTSSNCSSLGAHTGAGVPGHAVTNVIGIVKAYQTRVGGGPMPTELHDKVGDTIRERGREYGTTTGRPRRCGWLDLVALKYTATVSGATGIALTLLDVLAGLEELKVCVAYRHGDKQITSFPAEAEVLDAVEPVYETLEGFGGSLEECRRFSEL
ncbi:MAG: adenylosuccinate synthase, partial [Phycisphaeraceae bacterium]